jgi:Asp-tRNA(Asn)/Glu-tRNA(Gln) amidotransferase C subunit
MDIINKAASAQRDSATATPNVKSIIDQKTIEILAKDEDELEQMQNQLADDGTHDPMTNPADMVTHMREMIEQGLSNEEILELHPEIGRYFGGSNGTIPGQDGNTQ